jgi:ribonuclease D
VNPGNTNISREALADLPIRRYEGEVGLVAAPPDLERALADLRSEAVIGLDTETRPAFVSGQSYAPSLAQVATARTVWIFQLQRVDCSQVLTEMLTSSRVKAGVNLAEDLRQLQKLFAFEPQNIVDLGVAAKRAGAGQTGLRNLAGMYLGFRIPKGKRTSNWAAPRLSPEQISYAAMDAWACRELYLHFRRLGLVQ